MRGPQNVIYSRPLGESRPAEWAALGEVGEEELLALMPRLVSVERHVFCVLECNQ